MATFGRRRPQGRHIAHSIKQKGVKIYAQHNS